MLYTLLLIAGFIGTVLYILFTALLIVIVFAILKNILTDAFDGNLDKTAKPTKPDVAKWPRRIPTIEGDVLVYRSGKVRLIDEQGNVWKAKLHDDLLGPGEV